MLLCLFPVFPVLAQAMVVASVRRELPRVGLPDNRPSHGLIHRIGADISSSHRHVRRCRGGSPGRLRNPPPRFLPLPWDQQNEPQGVGRFTQPDCACGCGAW